jgi:chemotaxis protein CheD
MIAPIAAPAVLDWTNVFLTPGGVYCTAHPTIITTILGSCISVCLWDRLQRIGGMNHFVLPEASTYSTGGRYGDVSLELLLAQMIGLGSRTGAMLAKVFGGAAVLPMNATAETVGERNLDMALRTLKRHRVSVAAHRTGGESGKLIKFNTWSGEVAVRDLDGTQTGP